MARRRYGTVACMTALLAAGGLGLLVSGCAAAADIAPNTTQTQSTDLALPALAYDQFLRQQESARSPMSSGSVTSSPLPNLNSSPAIPSLPSLNYGPTLPPIDSLLLNDLTPATAGNIGLDQVTIEDIDLTAP